MPGHRDPDIPRDRAIEAAYAAAGDGEWEALALALAALVEANTVAIFTRGEAAAAYDLVATTGLSPAIGQAYEAHWKHQDPWALALARRPDLVGRAMLGQELVRREDLLRSAYHNEFSGPNGTSDLLGCSVPLSAHRLLAVGLHRPEDAPPMGEAERRALEGVLPHLRRAAQLHHRLTEAEKGAARYHRTLDALSLAVVVADGDGRVALANAAAEALVRPGGALRLGRAPAGGGRLLEARHRDDAHALRAALVSAAGGGAGGSVRLRTAEGSTPLAALVSPLPNGLAAAAGLGERDGGIAGGLALVLLRPLGPPPPPPPGLLGDLFGLSGAEAAVATAMAAGRPAAAVAAARGVSEATVRSQLRAALDKSEASGLRELAGLLATLGEGRRS